jgi:two-component system sensor histidine kinase DesK
MSLDMAHRVAFTYETARCEIARSSSRARSMRDAQQMEQIEKRQRSAHAAPGVRRSTFLWWAIWLVWLPLSALPVIALAQAHPTPLRMVISLSGFALFFGVYLWTGWQSARNLASPTPPATPTRREQWLPIVVLLVLGVALTLANGWVWGGLFYFTLAAAGGRLPRWDAVCLLVALCLFSAYGGWRAHMAASDVVSSMLFLAFDGLTVLTVVQAVRAMRTLRAEREELARFAAVTTERLRIARDLHDLLGHSLSLIALKSELAGRLAHVAPERAAAEIADIESVARTALREVRDAVAGYRQPTLADELRDARDILRAAGISYHFEGDERTIGALPSAVEAILSWAVREGVTNVIRHSRARHCVIQVTTDGGEARVEVRDDGSGALPSDTSAQSSVQASAQTPITSAESAGHGLRGLTERVAAVGGRLDAGPQPGGGFRLAIALPLTPGGRDEAAPRPASLHAAPVTGDMTRRASPYNSDQHG